MKLNILEVSKTMTREEFIEGIVEGQCGTERVSANCPELHGLASFDKSGFGGPTCNPEKECVECWTEALRGIPFKGDDK